MWPLVVFLVFIGLLVIGSIVTNITGHLPNAEELEAQDQARFAKLEAEVS